jgi:MFS family permease
MGVLKIQFSMILSRTRPSIFIPIITFAWGSVAALIGISRHQSHLIALRFLLGVFEAGFSVSTNARVQKYIINFSKASSDLSHIDMVSKERAVGLPKLI